MNYIQSSREDQVFEVTSKTNSRLEYSLWDAIYLSKQLKCAVSLKHGLGEYLVDIHQEILVVSGDEPDYKLLPMSCRQV